MEMIDIRREFKRRPRILAALASAVFLGLVGTATLALLAVSHGRRDPSPPLAVGHKDDRNANKTANSSPRPLTTNPSLRTSLQPSPVGSGVPPTPHVSGNSSSAPSLEPTSNPSSMPIVEPTTRPSIEPTSTPTVHPNFVSYVPGDLTVMTQYGLVLSTGLKARLLATSGLPVTYGLTGEQSAVPFHRLPDFGATYSDPRDWNAGGWIYVSNSEVRPETGRNLGGVGALTFDSSGNLLDYRMVLEGTTSNCGGGRTPWGSWISCEEYGQGRNWQVDPTGQRKPQPLTLGQEGGNFESFAYDDRHDHYFVTEDAEFGPLRRFAPDKNNDNGDDPWMSLHGEGTTTYLRFLPNSDLSGHFEWIHDKEQAGLNANMFYLHAEGIDVVGNELFFVSKKLKTMFILNLDAGTYRSHTTRRGLFDGEPDQIQRIIGGNKKDNASDVKLYFTEDGGSSAGVHARDALGRFYTILEAPEFAGDETTGLAFSPDGVSMYVAYQDEGKLFDITREDGLPFDAKTLNIKYHT